MKRIIAGAVTMTASIVFGVAGSAHAAAADDGSSVETEVSSMGSLYVVAGVRLWLNQWDFVVSDRELFLANPADSSSLMMRDRVYSATSSTEIVPIVHLGVRYRDFVGSASYFAKTSFETEGVLSEDVDREEIDLNLGYQVTPNFAVSLGYRRGTQSKTTDIVADSETTVEGLLVGASFSVPISGPFSAYGSVAYGLAHLETEVRMANGDDTLDGDYRVGEIGISYSLSHLLGNSVLKGAALTVGYRTWVITEDDVPLGTYALNDPIHPVSIDDTKIRTTADGFVIGAVAVF